MTRPISSRKGCVTRRAFSPSDQAALYVVGDSLSQTPGESVINQALATQSIGILGIPDTHVGTGLARPEVFNWPAYLAEAVARDHPDAVVLTIGSNDDQSLTGDGGGESFAGPDWIAEYHRRVGGRSSSRSGNIGNGGARMSIPFFYEARADAEIRPLPMDGAASFEPFFYGDYLWATTTQFVEFKGMESLRKPMRQP